MHYSQLAHQIARTIADEIGAQPAQARAAIALLDEGASVPFIARYRKEVTGGLDDTQLRNLETRLTYLRELEERRAVILSSIGEQGKLSDELRDEIVAADTKSRLEDLYLPTSPSAAPARRSREKPDWSHWPMACCRTRRRRRKSPRPPSSMPKRALPTARPRWKARAQS